jgi:hypothetical protein
MMFGRQELRRAAQFLRLSETLACFDYLAGALPSFPPE